MSPTEGILTEAWNTYKRHWQHFVTIALVVYGIVAIVALLLDLVLEDWAASLLAAIVSLVGAFWLQGALVRAVDDVRDGRADLSLSETFSQVQPKLGSIIVAGVLAVLGILLGLVLLIVPGLVLLTWWILIIPAIVLENRSAGESFRRSRELVRGYGWNVFGVIVLTILVLIAFRIVLGILLFPLSNELENFLNSLIGGTLATPFAAIAWTLLYFRLRRAKEETLPAAAEPAM